MRDLPILFSAPMVRALLDGSKTQTRRQVKPPKGHPLVDLRSAEGDDRYSGRNDDPMSWGYQYYDDGAPAALGELLDLCPYGRAGDRLWVREAWRAPHQLDNLSPNGIADACLAAGYNSPWCPVQYEACGTRNSTKDWYEFGSTPGSAKPGRYRHGRFMPRWASRISLEVTGVRIERLQAISEADARAEGAHFHDGRGIGHSGWRHDDGAVHGDARSAFARLWESLNGAGSWEQNAFVWVVSFRRI
ncbi:hypothetical protein A7A76_20005 [Lysobacter enzymogenes]|uniref:hypothetical protein n=1 Tax=Lysobacter enzymogenes TaxID=69 RepID=UPI0019D020E0|nr:hypothetical protein [Lysobacter enzymogenes]MBN7137025.1 hypothetical protein [Lysobacter enzymogenes]